MSEGTPLLGVADLSVRFGGVHALDSVTLDFSGGEICGLIGPNGAGKTTLLDVITGIRPPSSGRVTFDGVDITGLSVTARARRGLARTFQRQQLFGWLSVEDNVMTALEWRGGGGGLAADLLRLPTRARRESARRARVAEVLGLCGIADLARASAAGLPLGKARMVELARAVIDAPRVLLLDEPTSGLEPQEVESMGDTIRHVRSETGCAVVLIEHDVGFVMQLSDRIVALELGSVLAQGTPEEVRDDEAVVDAYFGTARRGDEAD